MVTKKQMHNITAILFDKRGRPLSIGRNSYTKTHPLQAQAAEAAGEPYKVFLHAEIDAIVRCRDMNKAVKMVVMRYNKHGVPMNAAPCNICRRFLQQYSLQIQHT
jgi:cytidine deaminase